MTKFGAEKSMGLNIQILISNMTLVFEIFTDSK